MTILVASIFLVPSCLMADREWHSDYGRSLEAYSKKTAQLSIENVAKEINYLIELDSYIHYEGTEIPDGWADFVTSVSTEGTVIKIGSSDVVERNAENSFFDEGAVWTVKRGYGTRIYEKQADTVWNVTLSNSYPYGDIHNIEASGTFSYAQSQSTKKWSISVSGTTSEESEYSTSFRTMPDYTMSVRNNGIYAEYVHYGTFVTDLYKGDDLFDTYSMNLLGDSL